MLVQAAPLPTTHMRSSNIEASSADASLPSTVSEEAAQPTDKLVIRGVLSGAKIALADPSLEGLFNPHADHLEALKMKHRLAYNEMNRVSKTLYEVEFTALDSLWTLPRSLVKQALLNKKLRRLDKEWERLGAEVDREEASRNAARTSLAAP